MFGILGKAGGLRVNSADPRTLKAIEKTKADALADLREYDSMAN